MREVRHVRLGPCRPRPAVAPITSQHQASDAIALDGIELGHQLGIERDARIIEEGDPAFSAGLLIDYPILMQGAKSGSGLYFSKWLKSEGVVFPRVLTCDSMTAVLGLAVAGLGVSYLPLCFRPLIEAGKLMIVPTRPALPPVPYTAMYRNDRPSALTSVVVELARTLCDFSKQLQG
ncbi:substrate-binding domain-containing protein [Bradyrhizobium sp. STM 3562]|uniref:substrate-binding domain-containing protein n=1 Tax=Bradyrhizobium sp. STM 3562 TaxID=578924 RepID=UPI00388F71E2